MDTPDDNTLPSTDKTLDENVDAVTEQAANFAATAQQKVSDFANAYPVGAVLASAALGAGAIALIALMARETDPVKSAVKQAGVKGSDYDDLKSQLADLAASFAAAWPSKSDVQSMASSASGAAASQASGIAASARDAAATARSAALDKWSDLRDKTQAVLSQVQPQLGAAVDLARANPLWSSVAAGALGALIGAQVFGRRD